MTNCSSDGPDPYDPEPGTGTGATGNPGIPGEGTGASGNPGGGGTGVPGTGGGNNGEPLQPIDPNSPIPPTKPGGKSGSGYTTQYWDCCKVHCSWIDNVQTSSPYPYCSMNGITQSKDMSVEHQANSGCQGGSAYACYNEIPRQVSDTLSYAYAAVAGNSPNCGACYQIEFTGKGYDPGQHKEIDDPGSAKLKAAGKILIVQETNIGHDVGGGQFDIQIPGGGVGAFNGCSAQWGVSNDESVMGKQYGGLRLKCQEQFDYQGTHEQVKQCVQQRCGQLFSKPELSTLKEGCLWYADWLEAADNPQMTYKEVECPSYFTDRWK